MILLHNVGYYKHSNYNTREQIKNSKGPISFDGIYLNVYENQDILEGKDVILFVMGNYVGGDNTFDMIAAPDYGLKLEKYCTWDQIFELRDKYKCRVGWHTWSHRDLTKLPDHELEKELKRPDGVEPILAYPFGNFDRRVESFAHAAGYREAWTVDRGDNSPLQQQRHYLT
ncbi:nodB-like protein [Caudoviricetes sp.]|nr:nodB-like protein [Caudoviricetes sp.]